MRSLKLPLNITLVNFDSLAEEVEKTFNTEIKKMFSVFVVLSHKDRERLYLYYTLRHVLRLHKKHGNKNVVFYVNFVEGKTDKCILDKITNISSAFPVMIHHGPYSFDLLEQNKGELIEVTKDVTSKRLGFHFESFTKRKIENFCKLNKIKEFALVSDF